MNDTSLIHDIAWFVVWNGTMQSTLRHADPPSTREVLMG